MLIRELMDNQVAHRITAQASRAMMEHLIPRSVAVILHTLEDKVVALGSGTPIQIGGRYFVSAAAHVLEGVDIKQVGVIALGNPGLVSDQTPRLSGWGRRGGHDRFSAVDIGWLEIKPGAIPALMSKWGRIFVTLDRVSLAPVPLDSGMYVLGTPWELRKEAQYEGRPFFGVTALPYLTRTVSGPPYADEAHDICVEYLSEMHTEEGKKPLPAAEGLSGSGLWWVPSPDRVWAPDQARLVAVQHSSVQHEYLCGTLW